MPLGLGMALAQNEKALESFANLSDSEKQNIINRTRTVTSKKEMQQLVASISDKQAF
ncbi:MAG TPA: hypothetical protein GX401_08985 [Clostridiales bacterium]|nr:hypothetical protein [Clostridiales bacterium]